MFDIDPSVAIAVLTVVGSGGIAFGSTRMALNGTKAKVAEIQTTLTTHVAQDHATQIETVQRLTRIETKIDTLLGEEND